MKMGVSRDSVLNRASSSNKNVSIVDGRPKIAFLLPVLDAHFESNVRTVAEQTAAQLDVNFLCVVGRFVEENPETNRAHTHIYDLITPHCVDGVIALTNCLGYKCQTARVVEFMNGFEGLARCSLGIDLPGIPSIVADNYQGMHLVTEHLVSVHRRRRVAYIGGPESGTESRARRSGFLDALAQAGLKPDPQLEFFGDFFEQSGFDAVNQWLDADLDIDGIVAANDQMALGAMVALKERDIRVPNQIALGGFDNIPAARFCLPRLTTVSQPIDEMIRLGFEFVLNQLRGESVSDCQAVELTACIEVLWWPPVCRRPNGSRF